LRTPGQDGIFPYFVANHIPQGLSGLIIAGMFAAGISTLDSALTALSQTTVVGIRSTIGSQTKRTDKQLLKRSRYFVAMWGAVIGGMAVGIHTFTSGHEKGLIDIGLQVPGFVYGGLLGLALLALKKNVRWEWAITGALAGCGTTLLLWAGGIGSFWWYPAATLVTYVIGYNGSKYYNTAADHR